MPTLTSSGTFAIGDAATEVEDIVLNVLPAAPVASGLGRIVHPVLGAFDYEVKPDEWVNIDGDVIIPPVWASARTLTSGANVLWPGNIRDGVVEERWKALGGLAMPVSMIRMLILVWMNPVDPVNGYVTWYPNYISPLGFQVIPMSLTVGGQGITLNDVINYKDAEGNPDGWVTDPVILTLKIAGKL